MRAVFFRMAPVERDVFFRMAPVERDVGLRAAFWRQPFDTTRLSAGRCAAPVALAMDVFPEP